MLTCGLSGWLELHYFSWIVNNRGGHLHQFRLEICTHKSRIFTIIAIMKQMVLLAVAVILGDSALEPRMAQSRHVNPVFHSRRVYFPDFSRHISHLCFLSRCQRERERGTNADSDQE